MTLISRRNLATASVMILAAVCCPQGRADMQQLNGHRFTLPEGFVLELAAGPPLVERPICVDFDEQGRLYVAESSGSNDPVQEQLSEKPHRILRLEDTDGDGRFDHRTVFADRMMFPEGTLWHDGSLYVAAPPVIWKLTDTDGDGVADQRSPWFDGQTLTGCANDLHGPYLGPDGWIYWCKGAFAEQTYDRPGRAPLVTRASHLFRRRPEGGPIEPVMSGGMDNPVEVAFTPGGERIFTTTFFQHPGGGRRDGLIHALYGGLYGKRHQVLDGHPATGELLPPLVHLGAAAPSGLLRWETDRWGAEYRDNLFTCCFNMHKITRHQLSDQGTTFGTVDTDFLVSDQLDFHPTDVIEDADGSLLVIDTGGWYKLCCPTSQLWKPDVLGAIYRVRRTVSAEPAGTQAAAHPLADPADPRGREIPWSDLSGSECLRLLEDPRVAVRRRAAEVLARSAANVPLLAEVLGSGDTDRVRLEAVWTLTRIDGPEARTAVRRALADASSVVRQAALHSISVHRDKAAKEDVARMLANPVLSNRRAAAEALGRIGDVQSVPRLLAAAADPQVEQDRGLEHSLIYALIELNEPKATSAGLTSESPGVRRAALIALDQMDQHASESAELAQQVIRFLDSPTLADRSAAQWIVQQHPEWARYLLDHLRRQLQAGGWDADARSALYDQLIRAAESPEIQGLLAETLSSTSEHRRHSEVRQLVLEVMADSRLPQMPSAWEQPLRSLLAAAVEVLVAQGQPVEPVRQAEPALIQQLVAVCRAHPKRSSNLLLDPLLMQLAELPRAAETLRLQALAALGSSRSVDPGTFQLLMKSLPAQAPLSVRSLAADAMVRVVIRPDQYPDLLNVLPEVGPLELERVLEAACRQAAPDRAPELVKRLAANPSVTAIAPERLDQLVASLPETAKDQLATVRRQWEQDAGQQRAKLESVLAALPEGDVRRGQQVFHSEQAACFACHALGYLGGDIGPDLTRIGGIRSERDLLEAILYPSASFVRSYEPVNVVLVDGRVLNGLVREDNGLEVVLTTSDRKTVRLLKSDIELLEPSRVSVMPAGLEKQLTPQQLADLLAFLRDRK